MTKKTKRANIRKTKKTKKARVGGMHEPNHLNEWIISKFPLLDPHNLFQNPMMDNVEMVQTILHNERGDREYVKQLWQALCVNPNENILEFIYENRNKLDSHCWENLSKNPQAMKLIKPQLSMSGKINWSSLSGNPGAITVLEKNIKNYEKEINYSKLCSNPNAMSIILRPQIWDRLTEENKRFLSVNPAAMNYLKKHPDLIDLHQFVNMQAIDKNTHQKFFIKFIQSKIDKLNSTDWFKLSSNPFAIKILKANLDKVDWQGISQNPQAFHLLEQNRNKINWYYLSSNPNAMELLQNELLQPTPRINWQRLCMNPNAMRIIEFAQNNTNHYSDDNIDWSVLSKNPGIFQDNTGLR